MEGDSAREEEDLRFTCFNVRLTCTNTIDNDKKLFNVKIWDRQLCEPFWTMQLTRLILVFLRSSCTLYRDVHLLFT